MAKKKRTAKTGKKKATRKAPAKRRKAPAKKAKTKRSTKRRKVSKVSGTRRRVSGTKKSGMTNLLLAAAGILAVGYAIKKHKEATTPAPAAKVGRLSLQRKVKQVILKNQKRLLDHTPESVKRYGRKGQSVLLRVTPNGVTRFAAKNDPLL